MGVTTREQEELRARLDEILKPYSDEAAEAFGRAKAAGADARDLVVLCTAHARMARGGATLDFLIADGNSFDEIMRDLEDLDGLVNGPLTPRNLLRRLPF